MSKKSPGYWLLSTLALSGFVTSFGAHIVATNLPSYAQLVGVGALMIGLLIGVYDFAELFVKPVAGFIADKKGMKLTLLSGLAIFGAGSLLYLALGPAWLLIVRFAQGFGAAALSTVSITLVAKYFEDGRGRAFGIYNAVKGAGYVIAPAAGGFLSQTFGFQSLFVVSAAVAGIAFVCSLFLPKDRDRSKLEDDDDEISLKDFFSIFADRALLPVYAVITINMFLVGIMFGFLPVYLHTLKYSALNSGIVVSLATLAYLIVQPFAGHLADRCDVKRTVFCGLLLSAACVLAITFTTGAVLYVLVILAGIGIGTVWTNSDVLVSTLAKEQNLGATMGAAQSFKEFGDMVGPILVGAITQFLGIQAGFTACGVLALMALFALARFTGQRPSSATTSV